MVMIQEQVEQLIALGVHELAGRSAEELRALAAPLAEAASGSVLAVHPELVAPQRLMPLIRREGRPGFVVEDLTDLEEFVPVDGIVLPEAPLYLLHDVRRGDERRNWSPDEALPALVGEERSPLTASEGISWLLQDPEQLAANRCFMCIGSRRRKPGSRGGLDARVPALWISGGTGRDGAARRHAAKLGWCWAGNRHTWLGFASTSGRSQAGAAAA